jgi:DNA-binding transcriptional regulator YdaS (Cro superfamily)
MTPKEALERAIEAAGSQTAFAAAIGPEIKTGHVYHWLKSGRLPLEHCPIIEAAFGVSCEDLRPDFRWELVRQSAQPASATTEAAHG